MHREMLSRFLIEARGTLGLTQKQVGEALGVDDSQVSRWERGEALPGPQRLVALADALKVDLDELRSLFMEAQQEEAVSTRHERDLLLAAMRNFVDKYSEFHEAYARWSEEIGERVRRIDEQLEDRIASAVVEALSRQKKKSG